MPQAIAFTNSNGCLMIDEHSPAEVWRRQMEEKGSKYFIVVF